MSRSRAGRIALLVALATLAGVPAHSQAPRRLPGEKYALLVGVRQYNPNELRPLAYSEPDVVELAAVLKGAGYRRVVLMTQTEGAGNSRFLPTAANIRTSLKGILEDRDEDDSVVVAFAGHGVQFQGSEASYFCPMDARLADPSTLIALDEVYRAMEHSQAGVKVLVVDACRNDPQSDNSRSRSQVRLESATRPQLRRPPGGVAALFSCSPGEKAFEHATLKHGIFYHFLIRGLKGEADQDRDGSVDLDELAHFTRKRVPDFVKEVYGDDVRQMPVLKGEIRGLPVLVRLDGAKLPDAPASRPDKPETARVDLAVRTTIPTPRPTVPGEPITNSLGMKFVLIPAGEFEMGSPDSDKDAYDDEKPRHRVRITRPFYLGVTEVTQGQYRSVTGQSPSHFKGSDDLPVESVSWNDAIGFCNTLSEREGLKPYYQLDAASQSGGEGYRLPTEAEWEYACRAGTPARYSFGDDEASLGEFAWFEGNSVSKTHPVGQKRPNAFGLFDMHGNVWEWCWDGYGEKYYAQSPAADPSGPSQAADRVDRRLVNVVVDVAHMSGPSQAADRVNRGGGWSRYPRFARSARRLRYAPGFRNDNLGFRVARVQSGH